jgi:hypothetical protein
MTKRTRMVFGAAAAILVVLGIVAMAQGLGAKGQGVPPAAPTSSGMCMGMRPNVCTAAAQGVPGACVATCRANPNAAGNGVVGSGCDMAQGGSCGPTDSGSDSCGGEPNVADPAVQGCGMMR